MKAYQIFVAAFIISIVAMIIFFASYFYSFFRIMDNAQTFNNNNMPPSYIFRMFFSPTVVISFIVLCISSLTYKILGIVFIAKNPTIESSNRVLWILGFIFLSFVTAIVFMALKNSKNLLATKETLIDNSQTFNS